MAVRKSELLTEATSGDKPYGKPNIGPGIGDRSGASYHAIPMNWYRVAYQRRSKSARKLMPMSRASGRLTV